MIRPASLRFAFRGRDLLVRILEGSGEASRVLLPSPEDWAGLGRLEGEEEGLDVGEIDGKPCHAVALPEDWQPPAGFELQGLRRLWGVLPDEQWRMAGRAVQLLDWDGNHRFCGRCSTATERTVGEWVRTCPGCGLQQFPRLSPAVIVRIDRGDRLLLARSPHFAPGVYSTLAGFVEPGESLEEAVAREVLEEVGVRIGNVRYFGSQPWPFPNSLMIGFVADYESGEIRCQEGEIEDAAFFAVDALPGLPSPMSIARALIDDFLERR